MNELQTFKRKLELRHKKAYRSDEIQQLLDISASLFYKVNAGFLPVSDELKKKMKKVLAM